MAGFEQSLQAGETVVLKLRPHPILYLRSAIWALLAIAFAAAALLSGDPRFWGLASLLTAGAAVAAALHVTFLRRTMALAITDRRVLLSSGVLRRRLAEAFPASIVGFEMLQGPLGRAAGYAQVRIRGLGDAPWLVLPEAQRLRHAVEALALPGPSESPPATSAPQPASIEPAPHAVNGDARPRANGNGAAPLKPQAQLDRF